MSEPTRPVHPPLPSRALVLVERPAETGGRHVSTFKKLLMSLMVLGAVGTTVGAGTFASFTGQTSNAAAFSSGSVILSNTGPSATACVSTGGTESGGAVTAANNNDTCDVMFDATAATNATSKRPGESGSVVMHLKNVGTITGALSVRSAAPCTTSSPSDQPSPKGTADDCDVVRLSIEDGTTCYWGDNMGTTGTAPFITGAPLTYPVVLSSSNNQFKLIVDGVSHDSLVVAAGSYATAAALASAVTTPISAWATATPVGDQIRITSKALLASPNLTMNIPTTTPSAAGLFAIGFIDGANAAGPGKCATKTGERDHTLTDFITTMATTPLALGTLSAGTNRDFTVTLAVPAVITDLEQARKTGFELTWTLTA